MRSAFRLPALILILAVAAACGGEGDRTTGAEALDRETFIEVYVDLRRAALANADREGVSPEQRERVLDAHGVGEEDLLDFARVHGRDSGFMVEVWTEVEERLEGLDEEGRPLPPDTSTDSAPDAPDAPGSPPRP